jgi:hypothetical protein
VLALHEYRRRPARFAARALPAAVAMAIIPGLAAAVPRFSARYEQKCALCHVNPSGGGLRTLYASQYLVPEEIAWAKPGDEILSNIDPEISKNVVVGTDFRLIHRYSDDETPQKNFFQMQGDIYVDFRMDESLSLYYDQGISSRYELFGLWEGLPLTGYVKLGRFVPAYGWKFDDHTMFVRSELGFFPPGNSDVGIEFGLSPQRFDVQFGLLNGNRGGTSDNNEKFATMFSGAWRFHAGEVGAAVGAAGYWEDNETANYGTGGTFGYVLWRRLAWLYQVDWTLDDPQGVGHTTGFVASNELAYLVRKGFEVRATYDFFDPDFNVGSGAKSRWGGGVWVMPKAFLALEALYRATRVDEGPALSGDDTWETVLQFHLLY